MNDFTPGPWLLAEDGSPFVYALNNTGANRFFLNVSSGWVGEFVPEKRTSEKECLANAHLIAAAPDMYKALKKLCSCITETRGPNATKALYAAETALAKARG